MTDTNIKLEVKTFFESDNPYSASSVDKEERLYPVLISNYP